MFRVRCQFLDERLNRQVWRRQLRPRQNNELLYLPLLGQEVGVEAVRK